MRLSYYMQKIAEKEEDLVTVVQDNPAPNPKETGTGSGGAYLPDFPIPGIPIPGYNAIKNLWNTGVKAKSTVEAGMEKYKHYKDRGTRVWNKVVNPIITELEKPETEETIKKVIEIKNKLESPEGKGMLDNVGNVLDTGINASQMWEKAKPYIKKYGWVAGAAAVGIPLIFLLAMMRRGGGGNTGGFTPEQMVQLQSMMQGKGDNPFQDKYYRG